jgi:phenylacetate-CoA ligase
MAFLHEHLILPLSDLIRGEQVYKYLRLLRVAEDWDGNQLKAFQKDRLQKLLVYVSTEVPFYHDWFHTHGLNPDTITLDQLPVVNKELMRQEGIERFSAMHFPDKERMATRSGGSTGEPFSFYETRLSYSVNMAAKLRTWYQAGYHLGDRYMKITNGKRPSKIKNLQDLANNCLFVPFYSITDETLVSILDRIEHSKPLFIRSYPSPLYLLARYRNSHPGYSHRPRHIFTTGATLPDAYREEIERAFGCDVIDSYSCEGTPNTYETPAHDGYRTTGYYGIIEVLDNDSNHVTNGIGRVVSTDLWNLAHPFIRYDTQDLVEVRDGKIVRIMGRQCETLLEANGQLLTVHNFTHFFADNFPSVDGWQVVHHANGNITFRLVVNERYSPADGQRIIDHWSSVLGANIDILLVDALHLTASNKHLSIINEAAN